MRATVAVALAALLLCSWPETIAQPSAAQCHARANVLGVSRVVEIDTASGPRFGHQQYKDIDFLQDGEIVLTFDDGPSRAHTLPVLDALDAHCTKATFFAVGRMAVADPEMLRETARRGHTIGTHTWSHRNLRSLSPAQARQEIELGISAVQAALGGPIAPFFRFPYLSDPQGMQAHLMERRMGNFSIDVDSYDYKTPDAATMQRNILRQLAERKKGILLFHDIQASTARGLKGLLDELKARGFRVVHLVAKHDATTIAEFDAMAEKALGRRRVVATDNPLSKRSVVWPLADEPRGPPLAEPTTASSGAGSGGAPARPVRIEEERWQDRIFRN